MIFIYITAPKKIAEKIAINLLRNKLAACINMFPIKSFYLWKGKIEKTKEYVCIIKTLEEQIPKIKREIEKIHPYDVTCICKINVKANKEFKKWLKKEIR